MALASLYHTVSQADSVLPPLICNPVQSSVLPFLYSIALSFFYRSYIIMLYDLTIYCVYCVYPSWGCKFFMKCRSSFYSLIHPKHPELILEHNGYSDIWWRNNKWILRHIRVWEPLVEDAEAIDSHKSRHFGAERGEVGPVGSNWPWLRGKGSQCGWSWSDWKRKKMTFGLWWCSPGPGDEAQRRLLTTLLHRPLRALHNSPLDSGTLSPGINQREIQNSYFSILSFTTLK